MNRSNLSLCRSIEKIWGLLMLIIFVAICISNTNCAIAMGYNTYLPCEEIAWKLSGYHQPRHKLQVHSRLGKPDKIIKILVEDYYPSNSEDNLYMASYHRYYCEGPYEKIISSDYSLTACKPPAKSWIDVVIMDSDDRIYNWMHRCE